MKSIVWNSSNTAPGTSTGWNAGPPAAQDCPRASCSWRKTKVSRHTDRDERWTSCPHSQKEHSEPTHRGGAHRMRRSSSVAPMASQNLPSDMRIPKPSGSRSWPSV
eukprot:5154849-Lingulodinium_polyedra.AAC.1